MHDKGAILIFLGVHCHSRQTALHLPLGRFLGWLSFSIYVLHISIIAFVASFVIVHLEYSLASVLVAALATITVTLSAAYGVALLDQWWIGALAWLTKLSTSTRAAGAQGCGSDAP